MKRIEPSIDPWGTLLLIKCFDDWMDKIFIWTEIRFLWHVLHNLFICSLFSSKVWLNNCVLVNPKAGLIREFGSLQLLAVTKAQISEIIGCPARKISTKTFRIPSWALPLAICHRTYLSSVPSRLIARPPLCLQTTANDGKESDSIRWHHVQSRMRMTAASMTGRRRVFARFAQSAGLSDGELTMFATSSLLGSLVRRCPLPAMVSDTPTSCPARSLSDSALHLWG